MWYVSQCWHLVNEACKKLQKILKHSMKINNENANTLLQPFYLIGSIVRFWFICFALLVPPDTYFWKTGSAAKKLCISYSSLREDKMGTSQVLADGVIQKTHRMRAFYLWKASVCWENNIKCYRIFLINRFFISNFLLERVRNLYVFWEAKKTFPWIEQFTLFFSRNTPLFVRHNSVNATMVANFPARRRYWL